MSLFAFDPRVKLAGGLWYEYRPGWLPLPPGGGGYPEMFAALRRELLWRQYSTRIEGVGDVPYPRLECLYVMGAPINYRYGGVDHHSLPLCNANLAIPRRELKREGIDYNAVFANLYRSGQDSIGWHADDEPALGPVADVQIACVSLGVPRTLELRRASDPPSAALRIRLEPGSLFTMGPGLQDGWLHRIPKEPEVQGERIALTFRRVYS